MSEYVFRDANGFGCDMDEPTIVSKFSANHNGDHYGTLHEEVVRCRDCKYAMMSTSGCAEYCDRLTTLDEFGYPESMPRFDADFFCAYGERKADECQ